MPSAAVSPVPSFASHRELGKGEAPFSPSWEGQARGLGSRAGSVVPAPSSYWRVDPHRGPCPSLRSPSC